MSTPIWPTTLPQRPLVQGYTVAQGIDKVESRTDSGNLIQRQRFTSAPETISLTFHMDLEQKNLFLQFYKQTIGSGTIAYEWTIPDSDNQTDTALFRIIGQPRVQAVAGRYFSISFTSQKQV